MCVRFLLFVFLVSSLVAQDKPNVIFILADDMGVGDALGSSQVQMPELDSLREHGMTFTDAHVTASVCVPSRLSLMTGRYHWRFSKPKNRGPWGYLTPQINEQTFTLGKMFKQAAYNSAYIGKWHLGTKMTTKDSKTQGPKNTDYTKPLHYGPPQFGFDYSFILPGSLDMFPYAFIENNMWQGPVTAQKGWSAFNRVGPASEDFVDFETLDKISTKSEEYIAKQNGEDPFFLFVGLTGPHTPICPSPAFQGKSKLGLYGDFLMEIDHSVGRIVKALKEKGAYKNTLLVFSSDHGQGTYAGNIAKATPGQVKLLEEKGHSPNGPHRGYKFSLHEGGLRVPFIVQWPDKVKAGTRSNALVGLQDLMATFAELAGVSLKEHQAVDSISFVNSLTNPQGQSTRKNMIMTSVTEGPFVVRLGNWKLCLTPGTGTTSKYGNIPLYKDYWETALKSFGKKPTPDDLLKAPFIQLYDLDTDIREINNLANKHPEKVIELLTILREQIQQGRSTRGPKQANDTSVNIQRMRPKKLTSTD
ncbi:MAG: arylsulfatase [Lentisphaeraceae bacterium]|nr:arylsulfatase [Lentisphaeraceae bacterium]